MRALIVVLAKPAGQTGSALPRGSIVKTVGPFAQCGLDETFGLAVGARGVGASEEMAELELMEAVAKVPAAIAAAIVGHDAADGDAESGVVVEGGAQESQGGVVRLIGQQAGEGDAGVIVDGDVEILPAGSGTAARAQGMVAKLGAVKAAQRLDVEVEQASGLGILVAARRRRGIEGGQAVQAATAQDATHRGATESGVLCDPEAGPALPTQTLHLVQQNRQGAARRGARTGGAVSPSRSTCRARASRLKGVSRAFL